MFRIDYGPEVPGSHSEADTTTYFIICFQGHNTLLGGPTHCKMANESTPLIQTVRVAPARHRYPHNTCRRFFSIASCCLLISGFAYFAIHAVFVWPYEYLHGRHSHFSYTPGRRGKQPLSYDELVKILVDTPTPEKLDKWFHYYTEGPHLAGKNRSQVFPSQFIFTSEHADADAVTRLSGQELNGRAGASHPRSYLTRALSTILLSIA